MFISIFAAFYSKNMFLINKKTMSLFFQRLELFYGDSIVCFMDNYVLV